MKDNDWGIVRSGIEKKTALILSNVRVLSYFIVSIIFLGSAGIWLPWLDNTVSFSAYFRSDNIFTFVVALLGGMICNKIFHADRVVKNIFSELKLKIQEGKDHNSRDLHSLLSKRKDIYKEQLALSAVGLVVGAVSLLLVIYAYAYSKEQNSFFGIFGLSSSMLLYLYSSAEDIDDNTQLTEITDDVDEVFAEEKVVPEDILRDKD